MDKFVITGGKRLQGEVSISGAKNAAVAVIPAAILVEGVCRIENVPATKDSAVIVSLLERLGATVSYEDRHTLVIDSSKINTWIAPAELTKRMRASYYLIGALLGRFSRATVGMPGGCNFGVRPIDQHLKGFEALGATVSTLGDIEAYADKLHQAHIYFDCVSVGATINLMLAACRVEGTTVLENVAKEPHIVDVANFLNSMGADIRGAGTDVIKIHGVQKLTGGTYSIIPDQIEAGTFMIAAGATCGDVTIKNVIPKHLESISAKLMEMNINVEEFDDSVRVWRDGPLHRANVKTLPYPGFPTDLQPQIVALLSVAEGTSIINETIWENRFQYVDQLQRLGAKITVDGSIAVIEGVPSLYGGQVVATDLRAGASMVIAALQAQGVTEIRNLKYIDRGYEDFEQKLCSLGAQVERVHSEEEEEEL